MACLIVGLSPILCQVIQSTLVTGGLIVFGPFSPPLPFCKHFSTSRKTPGANFFKSHMVNYVCENNLVPISVHLGHCHQAITKAGPILH